MPSQILITMDDLETAVPLNAALEATGYSTAMFSSLDDARGAVRRENPDLMTQIRTLRDFARERALILVFISQIDRTYDPTSKRFPDIGDVRLPNPLDLSLFDHTCFLNGGEVRFQAA